MDPHSVSWLEEILEDTGLGVRRAFERAFRSGEPVFEAGEAGATLYVVQAGEVELTRPGPDGPRLIGRLGPGEVFGERSVLLGEPRTLRAVALRDTRLLELDRGTFESMCVERPEIALRIIERLAARTLELEQRLAGLGLPDLQRPLVRVLLRGAERCGAETRVRTTLRRLAAETGLSLLEAHRALEWLFQRKLLRLNDDVLVLPDLEALAACLDD